MTGEIFLIVGAIVVITATTTTTTVNGFVPTTTTTFLPTQTITRVPSFPLFLVVNPPRQIPIHPTRTKTLTTTTTTRLGDSTTDPYFELPPPSSPIDGGRNLLTENPEILASSPNQCLGLSSPLSPSREHVIETSLIPFNGGGGALKELSDQAVYVFPLVVQPKQYCVRFCLRAFLQANKEWVDEQILKYGAVLFRGFDITSAKEVEAGIRAFESSLSKDYRGTSPRISQDGSDYVFSAAEVPSHFPIAQHLEMSFLPSPPKRLFFSALKAPQGKVGGATAMTDFRKVYRDMSQRIIQRMASKKLKYTRTHYAKGASPLFTNDITALNSWSDVFGTTNKTLVEEICKKELTPMRWTGKNNDVFVSEYVSDAIQLHPQTKQPVWFNHAQVFHWTTFPAELWFAFSRSKDLRFALRSAVNWVVSFMTYVVFRKKMALNVTYGDGTPISFWEMHKIRRTIHKNMVFSQWQQGDLLMIDNYSTSHGREPTYAKGRKIVVSFTDPVDKANEYTSSVYGLLDAESV